MVTDARYKALTQYGLDLETYLSEPLTEADTRAKFVDVFLKAILGWTEEDIRRERSFWTDEKRAAIDYEVGSVRPLFLVEAKRLSTVFELPNDSGRALFKLDGVIASHPSLWSAIMQAREYCDGQGIPFALVTNGRQFALFRAITIDRAWREGSALVASVDTLLDKHFASFHEALCAESGNARRLDALLDPAPAHDRGARIADSLGSQVGRLSNRMSDVMEYTLGAILRDQPEPTREFLEQCYSMDASVDYYADSLRGLLKDPIPSFSPQVSSIRPGHKKDPFGTAVSATMDRRGTRPPLVIIGGKGFGKTTFLQWFMKASPFRKDLQGQVVLWVDFRTAGYSAAGVEQQVRRQLIDQLENSSALSVTTLGGLKEVFRERLDVEEGRFLAPFADDPVELEKRTAELIQQWRDDAQGYLLALTMYAVAHCGKQVVIVLDNADQKSSEFQVAVYNTSQQLATALPTTILISLRESTFYRLCKLPQADAFSQQQVFHIRAPNIKSVLNSRFEFLAKELRRTTPTISSTHGIDLTITDIQRFIRLLKRSLLEGKDATLIVELLAAVSNGSVREALNLVHDFLTSGHTKMEEYIRQYATNAKSSIPFHEFLTSIMLGEMAYFREDRSRAFINLFSRSPAPGDSHFTRLRLLQLIRTLSPSNELRPDDYVPLAIVKSRMAKIGVLDEVLDAHVQTLIRYGLVFTDTQTSLDEQPNEGEEYESVSSVHIAASGQYYLDVLCGSFQYLLRIIPDVPIGEEATFLKLQETFVRYKDRPMIPMDHAVQAVRTLVGYFDAEEQRETNDGVLRRDDILSCVRFVDLISRQLAPQLASIETWMARRDHRGD